MSLFWTLLELRMMEVVSGDNWSYKTAELQSVVHANKPTPSCLQVLLPNQQYQEH